MESDELVLCSYCRCSIVDEPLYIGRRPEPLCSEECVRLALDSLCKEAWPELFGEDEDDESLPF